jgi:hypothetical protein
MATLLISAAYLAVFVAGVPVRWVELTRVCQATACPDLVLRPAEAQALRDLGLSLPAYASFQVGLETLLLGLLLLLAGVIFWRRGDTGLGLLITLALITFGANILSEADMALALAQPRLAGLVRAMELLVPLPIVWLFFAFPNGRLVPRWAWVFVLLFAALPAAAVLLPGLGVTGRLDPGRAPAVLIFPVILLVAVGGQVYRYRFLSSSVERQQSKWVLLGLAGTALSVGLYAFFVEISPLPAGQPRLLFYLAGAVVLVGMVLLLPLSLAVSILRYRLWDIDVLIRRTLLYSALTATLALVYLAGVVGLQGLLRWEAGQAQSELVVVLSTLAIAALFVPLRRWLQAAIDRRFYRQRYDAARVLSAFGADLRAEVDLDTVVARLVSTVDETMQPETVSLWLREQPTQASLLADPWRRSRHNAPL